MVEKMLGKFISLAGKNGENIPRNKKTNAEVIPDNMKKTCKNIS